MTVRIRFPLVSLIALAATAPLAAQVRPGEVMVRGGVMPSGTSTAVPMTPSDTLAINLRVLAANPRDVTALTQAGISALAVGDPNAALGFLARAEQLSPTNGRVKAALGSVMVMMERPNDAMPFFRQAQALGVPDAVFASDRGLAFDLLGDPRQAQRDYAIALRQSRDPETVRRMALSLGLTGNRNEALTLLDPLLRQQDQAAWRARAFVLALTGDQRNADRIIQQVLPASAVPAMSDFLRRLPGLPVAARASAVNFGTLPATGPVYAAAEPDNVVRAIPAGMTDSLTRDEQPQLAVATVPETSRRKSRRRPGRDEVAVVQPSAPVPAAVASVAAADTNRKLRTREERVAELNRIYDEAERKRTGGTGTPVAPVAVATRAQPAPAVLAPVPAVRAPAPVVLAPSAASRPVAEPEPAPVFEISAPSPRPVSPPPAGVSARLPEPIVTAPAPAPSVLAPVPVTPVVAPIPPRPVPAPAPVLTGVAPAVAAPALPAPARVIPAPQSTPIQAVDVAARVPTTAIPTRVAAPVLSPDRLPSATAPALTPVPAPIVPAPVMATAPVSTPVAVPSPVESVRPPAPVAVASVPEVVKPSVEPVAPGFSPSLNVPAPVAAPVAVAAAAPPPAPAVQPVGLVPPAVAEGVQTSAVPTAAPVRAPSPLMGPPAPTELASAAPVSEPVPTALASPSEAIPDAPAETVTQVLEPDASAVPAKEEGLGSLLDDLAPEEERPAGAVLGDAEFRKARAAAKRKADLEAREKLNAEAEEKTKKAEALAKKEEEEAKKREAARHPARIWVQVATGSAKSGLGLTARRVREQAGDTLARYGSASVPYKATNRVLVGPFSSEGEARKTINALSKKGVQATMFSSDQGQEITKLAGK